jgi:hypothetical protein
LTESQYGGHYAPGTFEYFLSQNEKIGNGTLKGNETKIIPLDTVGITNGIGYPASKRRLSFYADSIRFTGCLDLAIEGGYYPEMAYNNTYDFHVIPEDVYNDAKNNMTKPGGCADLVKQCRALSREGDPAQMGTNDTVNQACSDASTYCFQYVQGAYPPEVGIPHAREAPIGSESADLFFPPTA